MTAIQDFLDLQQGYAPAPAQPLMQKIININKKICIEIKEYKHALHVQEKYYNKEIKIVVATLDGCCECKQDSHSPINITLIVSCMLYHQQ